MLEAEQYIPEIKSIIETKRSETLMLEFKTGDALLIGRPGGGVGGTISKAEVHFDIAKDVSAMANSAGGLLYYGISEDKNKKDKTSWADDYWPVTDECMTKIVLEAVIRDCIQPHFADVHVVEVPLYLIDSERFPQENNEKIYIIKIGQSTTALMVEKRFPGSSNGVMGSRISHRYYERIGTSVNVMPNYRVIDVMNRPKEPQLKVDFGLDSMSKNGRDLNKFRLSIRITNQGVVAAKVWKFKMSFYGIWKSANGKYCQTIKGVSVDPVYIFPEVDCQGLPIVIFKFSSKDYIFPEDEVFLTRTLNLQMDYSVLGSVEEGFNYILYADNMIPKKEFIYYSQIPR